MYYIRRNSKIIFLVCDIIAIILGVLLSFKSILKTEYSFYFLIVLLLIATVVSLFTEEYWDIADRGYLVEIKKTLLYTIKLYGVFILYVTIVHAEQMYKIVTNFSLLMSIIFTMILLYLFRVLAKTINKNFRDDARNIIIVSDKKDIDKIILPKNYKVIGYIGRGYKENKYKNVQVLFNSKEIRDFLAKNNVDEIYANINSHINFKEIIGLFEKLGITTKINITSLFDDIETKNTTIVTFQEDNIYLTSAIKIATLRQLVIKRIMDIVLSLAGIILMVIVAVVIYPKVRSQAPGPLIFKQTRIGQNGKRFEIYKFRSMYVDAEERKAELMEKNDLSTTLMFKMENDPRIFPFGQKLRDWSLDELPQFINVLKGDMSVVGTRPPTEQEYLDYELHHFRRMTIRPGITGLWQVSGRSDIKNFEEVVKLDTTYIENWSLRLDIKIILRTILVVLKREGSR